MEVNNYLRKFKLLFDYVLEEKIVVNEHFTEKLLNILENTCDNSAVQALLDTPCFSDIISGCLQNAQHASVTTQVFFLEIITILLRNELQFNRVQVQGLHGISLQYCEQGNLNTKVPPPALHMALIKLASTLMSHCSGLDVVLANKMWKSILYTNTHDRPIHIAKASYNFISKFVWNLNSLGLEQELLVVLEYVVNPIVTCEYIDATDMDTETDMRYKNKIFTFLKALLAILSDTENILTDNKVTPLLKSYFFLELNLHKIICATRCPLMIETVIHCLLRLHVAIHQNLLFNGKIDEFSNNIVVFHHNCVLLLIFKVSLFSIIEYIIQWAWFWNELESSERMKRTNFLLPLTFERNGAKLELVNQLTTHLFVPLLVYRAEYLPVSFDDIVERVVMKLSGSVTEHIYSSCYALRQLLLREQNIKKSTIFTIKELSRLKGRLNKNQAGKLFMCLYYVLETFIISDGAGCLARNEDTLKTVEDLNMLTHTLSAIRMLLMEHNICWYEIVEIVNLQAALIDLLKLQRLSMKQLVQILDLIDLCVKKFLSPNMTLLVESKQANTLTEIGVIMEKYIQHEDWEVRDSALHILLSCTEIAFIKFIPLQKVIKDNHLMVLATRAALTDPEFYAQVTALKCLATAAKIEALWREVITNYTQIHIQLFYLVRSHPEGMVRKEAANVITQIYVTQKLTETVKSRVYEVMVTLALYDLHWEAQIAALNFWNHAIQLQLKERGMIDGTFPAITFSKQKRKIIKLDEVEIANILTCILKYLSSVGCFTVLLECMSEEYNVEVFEQAHSIATQLVTMLDKYKVKCISEDVIQFPVEAIDIKEEANNMEIDLSFTTTSDQYRDSVIDNILEYNQSELIMYLHDTLHNANAQEHSKRSSTVKVHPNKFLEVFRKTDYLRIINSKKNWNEEIGSLNGILDEILDIK